MITAIPLLHRRYSHDHGQLARATSVNVPFRIWRADPGGKVAMIMVWAGGTQALR